MPRRLLSALVALSTAAGAVAAQAHEPSAMNEAVVVPLTGEAAQAALTVDAFHAALQAGETTKAADLMDSSAVIFEGGEVERSKAAYAAQHLAADAVYEKATTSRQTYRAGAAVEGVAWIATEGLTRGVSAGKTSFRLTTETMVLSKTPAGWRIVHVHWSSRTAPAEH